MSDFDRQIQRCKDQQRELDRLIGSCKRQIREADRMIQRYRRVAGGDRDAQRARRCNVPCSVTSIGTSRTASRWTARSTSSGTCSAGAARPRGSRRSRQERARRRARRRVPVPRTTPRPPVRRRLGAHAGSPASGSGSGPSGSPRTCGTRGREDRRRRRRRGGRRRGRPRSPTRRSARRSAGSSWWTRRPSTLSFGSCGARRRCRPAERDEPALLHTVELTAMAEEVVRHGLRVDAGVVDRELHVGTDSLLGSTVVTFEDEELAGVEHLDELGERVLEVGPLGGRSSWSELVERTDRHRPLRAWGMDCSDGHIMARGWDMHRRALGRSAR